MGEPVVVPDVDADLPWVAVAEPPEVALLLGVSAAEDQQSNVVVVEEPLREVREELEPLLVGEA